MTKPKTITQLLDAVYPSFALLAAMQLDVFTPLKDDPMTAEQLASALDVQVIKLRPLLNVLVVSRLLTIEDGQYANTPEADHYLVRGETMYMGGVSDLTSSNWERLLKTADMIRLGKPLEKHDYVTVPHDEQVAFFRGLNTGTIADANRLMEYHDFSSCNTLLDVGGGSGILAITIAQANPHLHATVIDLPSVTPVTRHFVKENNISDRVEIMAGDALQDTLSGSYDVIVVRHVIQVLSADDSRILLSNLAKVLKPGGVIHVLGWILDNSRLSPENIVGYNLILLNAYDDGQAYTEAEHHEWLTAAGLYNFKRVIKPDGASILTAYKPK